MPSAVPASRSPFGTSASPVTVLRMIGSSEYSVSAMSAGRAPMAPSSEISTASSASEGTVCITLAKPSTTARSRRCGNTRIASGTPMRMATPTDTATSSRCWRASGQRSGPKSLAVKPRAALGGVLPSLVAPARKSRAMVSKRTPCSSARAFIAIMACSSILPSSACNAAQAFGSRAGRSSL
ncbi:hypothetical protein D9M72_274860 [compost metagenome]